MHFGNQSGVFTLIECCWIEVNLATLICGYYQILNIGLSPNNHIYFLNCQRLSDIINKKLPYCHVNVKKHKFAPSLKSFNFSHKMLDKISQINDLCSFLVLFNNFLYTIKKRYIMHPCGTPFEQCSHFYIHNKKNMRHNTSLWNTY